MTKKALFLDRDGVINVDNKETSFVFRVQDFKFMPGIFELCKRAKELDYLIAVITNQGGIARGYYTFDSFIEVTKYMEQTFLEKGIQIDKVYFCPHDPDVFCTCRKPKPGMLLQARDELGIELSESIMIGDRISDMEAGTQANITRLYQIKGNYEFDTKYNCIDSFDEVKL